MVNKEPPSQGNRPMNESAFNPSAESGTSVPGAYPAKYEVWLLNDDYTPVDFVVFVLDKVFHKPVDEATRLTMQAHEEGQVSCGAFTREVAETKVMQVIDFGRENGYPLKCIMRKSHEYVIKKS